MAKKSMIARDKVRARLASFGRVARAKLRVLIVESEDYDDKMKFSAKLQKLRRNTSPVRVTRRCSQCGRPKGIYRKFLLCRICLRYAAMRGDVPGLRKSSW